MKSFFVQILISLLVGFVFMFFISKFINLPADAWNAFSVGIICALVYVISGFITYYLSAQMKQKMFSKIFILSIAGRIIFILGVIAIVLKFSDINREVFLISFLIGYFIFQIWEVISLNKILLKRV